MEDLKREWIHQPITQEIVEWCREFGKELSKPKDDRNNRESKDRNNRESKNPLTTSQLRKFFGEVKRIEMQEELCAADIIMLKPLLAYAVGRDKNNTRIRDFQEQMTIAINGIRMDKENITKDFKNFINIFEAIVAYHKYYGGK